MVQVQVDDPWDGELTVAEVRELVRRAADLPDDTPVHCHHGRPLVVTAIGTEPVP